MARSNSSALGSLSAAERAEVLAALLRAHPELLVEAEALAAGLLDRHDQDEVAAEVAGGLRGLHLGLLAQRAGPQWGGGYVAPDEAADELLGEVVDPYLDDLARRARAKAVEAAREIGLGVLLGLYTCREEDDNDLVLTHAGLPDAVDDLALRVMKVMQKAGLDLSRVWLAERCPAWIRHGR